MDLQKFYNYNCYLNKFLGIFETLKLFLLKLNLFSKVNDHL